VISGAHGVCVVEEGVGLFGVGVPAEAVEAFPFVGPVCGVGGGDHAECCFSGVFGGWVWVFEGD